MRTAVLITLLIAGLTASLPVSAADDTGTTQGKRAAPQEAVKEPAPPPSVTVIGARDALGILGRDVRSPANEDMEGSLREQLEAYAAAGREIFPAYGEAVDRLVARLNENGGGENAPRPGEVMPPFVLPDETGRLVSLKSLIDNGPVAVMFYRGHWCPYCRLNVRAVIQAQDRIKALGAQTVAIMASSAAADAKRPKRTSLSGQSRPDSSP